MATWYQLYFDDHGMPQLYLVKNHAGRYHWPREWGRLDLSPIAKSEFSRLSTFWLVTLPYHFLINNVIRSILLLHCQHSHHVLQASLVLAPPKMWFSGDTEAIPPLPTRERRRLILDILVFDHLNVLNTSRLSALMLDMAWHGLTWLDMAWHGLTRKEQQLLQLWSSGRGPEDACCTWQLILWNSDVVERNEFSFFLIFLCFLANKFKLCRLQCAQPLVEVVDPDEEWNQRLRGTGAAGRLAT